MLNKPLIKWRLESLVKNLKKGKLKALLRYVYDSSYRNDIDYMLNLVRKQTVQPIEWDLQIEQIVPGHAINYQDWVLKLRRFIRQSGYTSLEPIKVILDTSKNKYLIVDGNHRFQALKLELSKYQYIRVIILVPTDGKGNICASI